MDIFTLTTQEILDRISRHCPEALSTYLQCLNRADREGNSHFSKDLVDIDLSDDWISFRKNIKKLARENLLEWHPFNDGISIRLADIHADE